MHKRKARLRCEARLPGRDRFGVAVDGDKVSGGTECAEDRGAVAAAAEGGVDVMAGGAHGKSCKHRVDKHRLVLIQTPTLAHLVRS